MDALRCEPTRIDLHVVLLVFYYRIYYSRIWFFYYYHYFIYKLEEERSILILECLSNGYPHVFVETGALAEALATHRALVGAVLLVDMEDVDPQAVSLLERPEDQC